MNKQSQIGDPQRRPRWTWESWPYFAWLAAIVLLLIAILIMWSTSAAAQTRRAEQTIRQTLALRPDPANGAQLYARHCASCHGALALGNAEFVVPALAGQLDVYLIKQLVDVAESDREVPEMHRVLARAELISPQAIRDVTTFISGLKPNASNELGPGRDAVRGDTLYLAKCAACHGDTAQGSAQGVVPALRHQHYSYLLSQMRGLAVGHRYSVDIEVIEQLEALQLVDLVAMADAISRKSRRTSMRVPHERNGLSEGR